MTLPDTTSLEKCFNSFITWAGLQSFYGGIELDSLNDEAAVAMATFTAQTNSSDYVLSEDGSEQIISESDLIEAMNNLFGHTFAISNVSEELQQSNMIAVQKDNSIYLSLGDWGLVYPVLEILDATPLSDSDSDFEVNVRYYPYDCEEGKESETIASYYCTFDCSINNDSIYGFVIDDMKTAIK